MNRITLSLFLQLLWIAIPAALWAQTAKELASVSITVSDLASASRFYEEVLTFKKTGEYTLNSNLAKQLFNVAEPVQIATLQLGDERIELMEFKTKGRAIPGDSRSNDLWFQHIAIVVRDMDMAYQLLRKAKVQFVSTAPQTLPAYLTAAAGISAFYFQDPDGHNLEIIHFPAGKGDEKWQKASDKIFLGIDHTALGISDTDTSLAFYEAKLGLKVAGKSENYGTEQKRLNQVFGAHLDITGLKAGSGFGLEFLDYLAPAGGRAYPRDSKVNDLWHWHTNIFVPDTTTLDSLQQKQGFPKKIIAFQHPVYGNVSAAFLRDPDGHALLVLTR